MKATYRDLIKYLSEFFKTHYEDIFKYSLEILKVFIFLMK